MGFDISAGQLRALFEARHDLNALNQYGGVNGLADKLDVDLHDGMGVSVLMNVSFEDVMI